MISVIQYILYDLLKGTYQKDDEDDITSSNTNIFDNFKDWLTSYNNPDYTGNEEYVGYPRCLVKLVEFMLDKRLISDGNLNDLNVAKYENILNEYEKSDVAKNFDREQNSSSAGVAALKNISNTSNTC